jgi:hypothetical protein
LDKSFKEVLSVSPLKLRAKLDDIEGGIIEK